MKSDCSAASWLNFFKSAGIPEDSSRTYAVTFSKNEIQLDMLSEIKKEYLVDMGITLMGHIIAILRHAKTVYEENVTKSTLSTAPAKLGPHIKVVPKEKPVQKTMPLRISSEKENTASTGATKVPVLPPAIENRPRSLAASSLPTSLVRHPTLSVTEKAMPQPKREQQVLAVPKVKLASAVSNAVPPKKKVAVESSVRHSEDIMNKGKVFERLGNEVSSSQFGSPESSSTSSSESVFSRLGGKTSPSYSPNNTPVKRPYSAGNGVMKSSSDFNSFVKRVTQNDSKLKHKSMMCTMRADEAEAQAKRGRKRALSPSPERLTIGMKEFDTLRSNIKSRLGRMSRSVSPSSNRLRAASVDRSIGLREFGEFRSDKKTLRSRLGQSIERKENPSSRTINSSRGSILANRSSPVESIGLSGLGRSSSSIKSRLGQSHAIAKSLNPKKVSFGSVSKQFIPLERKQHPPQTFRNNNRRVGRLFSDDYFTNYNGTVNYGPGARMYNRFGYY